MENWFAEHWFDLIQSIGIIGGLAYTALTARQDTQSRQISNLIAVNERYNEIWQEFFRQPNLSRILKTELDLDKTPITAEEQLFVKMLMLHLDTVRRAMKAGVFVEIAGLKSDVREFLSLPIPKAVWARIRPFQNQSFADFVDGVLK